MNVSSAGAAHVAQALRPAASTEAAEVPGRPDHDGDADDTSAAASAPKAALPPGVGLQIDKSA